MEGLMASVMSCGLLELWRWVRGCKIGWVFISFPFMFSLFGTRN